MWHVWDGNGWTPQTRTQARLEREAHTVRVAVTVALVAAAVVIAGAMLAWIVTLAP